MAFFVFASVSKGGAKAFFRVMLKYFAINKSFMCSSLYRYYIKQIDSMSPCVCSVIDHRRRQSVVKTNSARSRFKISSLEGFFFRSQQLPYKFVYTCIDVISSEEDTAENTKHLSAP